jgi:hypothetical protein
VLSCGVNAVTTAKTIYTPKNVLCPSCRNIVEVKRQNITPCHSRSLTTAIFQNSVDIAPTIFEVVLLTFLVRKIIRQCFFAPRWDFQAFNKFRPPYLFLIPFGCLSVSGGA